MEYIRDSRNHLEILQTPQLNRFIESDLFKVIQMIALHLYELHVIHTSIFTFIRLDKQLNKLFSIGILKVLHRPNARC
jgi:hypothetical protein